MHLCVDDQHGTSSYDPMLASCRAGCNRAKQRPPWGGRTVLDRVMLTNDDGIDAPGMQVLEDIAGQIAREV